MLPLGLAGTQMRYISPIRVKRISKFATNHPQSRQYSRKAFSICSVSTTRLLIIPRILAIYLKAYTLSNSVKPKHRRVTKLGSTKIQR